MHVILFFFPRFVEEVIDSTLALLAINHNVSVESAGYITPMHLLALTDPKANWFTKWMVC